MRPCVHSQIFTSHNSPVFFNTVLKLYTQENCTILNLRKRKLTYFMYSGIPFCNFLFYFPTAHFETYSLVIRLIKSFYLLYRAYHLIKVTHMTHRIKTYIYYIIMQCVSPQVLPTARLTCTTMAPLL